MAVPDSTFATFAAVGIREDLKDLITNIAPVDSMFYSGLKKVKATQTKHEFLTRSLRAAGANAKLEGDAFAASAITPPTRLYNMTQIMGADFLISGSAQAAKAADNVTSIDTETAHETRELMKDIELAYLTGVRADGSAGAARHMRGALTATVTNLDKAGDATLNADGTVTGGTARPLTKDMIIGQMQNVFTAGGDPKKCYAGPYQKRQLSSIIQASPQNHFLIEGGKVDDYVDVFTSDFGTFKVVPHRVMPTDVVFLCDDRYWANAEYRSLFSKKNDFDQDGTRVDLVIEHTLEFLAENANARITDLATS